MADLIRDIDPNINMEEEVEEILLGYVDEFIDRVLNGASLIAKHRGVNNIEVKDVQQFISILIYHFCTSIVCFHQIICFLISSRS